MKIDSIIKETLGIKEQEYIELGSVIALITDYNCEVDDNENTTINIEIDFYHIKEKYPDMDMKVEITKDCVMFEVYSPCIAYRKIIDIFKRKFIKLKEIL